MRHAVPLLLCSLGALAGCVGDFEPGASLALLELRKWNRIAVDASGLDHTPVAPGDPRTFGEQYGPARAAKAMAVVHAAMFEAVNAIHGGYASYAGLPAAAAPASTRAAIAQAAHDTLVHVFPSQQANFDARLVESLLGVPNGPVEDAGVALGEDAAEAILAMRAGDGSAHAEPLVDVEYVTSDDPGMWRQDPVSRDPLALGAYWGTVQPFVLDAASQFRAPPPPALDSAEYAAAFEEAKRLGGDGVVTPTERTAEQTEIGIFWAYDGTPSLCAPPRFYNQIAMHIAEQMGSDLVETARLLALVNVTLADAGISCWEAKYHYEFWRPVIGIREADPGTGPTGLGDGNPATAGDPDFMPLGAPASNLVVPNFTPPFPTYPSGHATFGGALFETLRLFYGTDDIPFTIVSDEMNGITRDADGDLRPYAPRTYATLSQAEEENARSRIYLGIHWAFDATQGMAQGRRVAQWVFDRVFTPLP